MWNPFRIFYEHDFRWKELDKVLANTFHKVKTDKDLIFSWLHYLRKKDARNEKLQRQVVHTVKKHETEIQDLKAQIKELQDDVKRQVSPFPYQVRTKSGLESGLESEPVSEPIPQNRFVNRIVSMIRSQKKEYVMQKIIELAEKEEHTTKEIETVVVKEKGFCGRTAFYDYLRELRHKNLAKVVIKNGRKVLKTN